MRSYFYIDQIKNKSKFHNILTLISTVPKILFFFNNLFGFFFFILVRSTFSFSFLFFLQACQLISALFTFFCFFKIFICLLCNCNANLQCKYTKVVNIIHTSTKKSYNYTNFENMHKICHFYFFFTLNINLHFKYNVYIKNIMKIL